METVDDNTLFLSGKTAAGLEVHVLNIQNQILVSAESDSEGNFEVQFTQPLKAGEKLIVQAFDEADNKVEKDFIVQEVGLSLPERFYDTSTQLKGSTSAERKLELLDSEGKLITNTFSDNQGRFVFQVEEPIEAETELTVQVFDQEKAARKEFLIVEKDPANSLAAPVLEKIIDDQMLVS